MQRIKITIEGDMNDNAPPKKSNTRPNRNTLPEERWKKTTNLLLWGASLILFFVSSCCIWNDLFNQTWHKVAILATFLLWFLVIGLTHHIFNSRIITIIAVAMGLVLLLLALGVYSPQEVTKKLEEAATKKLIEKKK